MMECNFLIHETPRAVKHCFALDVRCLRFYDQEVPYYKYIVAAVVFGESTPVNLRDDKGLTMFFNTPEEAFAFADKVAEQYPRFNDKRDNDYALAPEYTGIPRRDKP